MFRRQHTRRSQPLCAAKLLTLFAEILTLFAELLTLFAKLLTLFAELLTLFAELLTLFAELLTLISSSENELFNVMSESRLDLLIVAVLPSQDPIRCGNVDFTPNPLQAKSMTSDLSFCAVRRISVIKSTDLLFITVSRHINAIK